MEEQLICTRCGTFIPDRHHLTWADDGKHLCYPCRERLDDAAKAKWKIHTGRGEIYGSLALTTLALTVALFIGWAMFVAVPAWNQARRKLGSATADDQVRAALGPQRLVMAGWLWLTGAIGAGLFALIAIRLISLATSG